MPEEKILIVEDELIVAEDIKMSLERFGYSVTAIVKTGEEAAKKADELQPDLVLMDIVLKGKMNGIDAAGKIGKLNIPVVFLTAYTDTATLERAKITEPYGYLVKPFEETELHSVIEIALYKSKMERKIKEREAWLFTTLKSIGDAVIASDANGEIMFMNAVAEELTGWEEKDAIGQPLGDVFYIINEKTRKRCENPVEKVLETGKIVGLANHTVLIAKDGVERLIADSGAPIRMDSDVISGVVLVFRDVTENYRIQEELRENENRFKELFENMKSGVAIYQAIDGGEDFIFVDFNRGGEEIEKIKREDIIGKRVSEAFPGVKEFGLFDVFQKVWRTGKSEYHPISFYKDEKLSGWRENYVLKLPSGEIVAIYDDKTEQKKIEDALRESEERMELALHGADLGTWDWNVQTGAVIFNERWPEMLGYMLDEIEPHISVWENLVHPDDLPGVEEVLNAHMEGKTDFYQTEHRLKHKCGGWIWVLDKGRVIERDADGKPVRACGSHLDITERKRAEEELKVAKEKAEHISEAKTEFLMNISHDIRTPMNVINGFNDLLMKTPLSKEQEKFCVMIKRKGTNLIRLIEDIIDISAVEKGSVRMHQSPFSIRELIQDIQETVEVLIGDKDIKFRCNISENVPQKLMGDSMRLKQVLENLGGNAVKYTEKGRIDFTISIGDEILENQTHVICFVLEDTGIGIPEDKMTYIFEPYARFYEAEKGKGKNGVGMGLHIVQTLIKEMGGKIAVESQVGKGSKFSFCLKMAEPGASTEEVKEVLPDQPDREVDLSGISILVAEDDEDNRVLMAQLLDDAEFDFQFACNGEEVIAEVKKRKYDVVLMDLRMPRMDGFEATQVIRKDIDKDIPIFALTAHVMDFVEDKCKEVGMNGYITKPVDIDKLKMLIRSHVFNS